MALDRCIIHIHHYGVIWNIFTALKVFCASPSHLPIPLLLLQKNPGNHRSCYCLRGSLYSILKYVWIQAGSLIRPEDNRGSTYRWISYVCIRWDSTQAKLTGGSRALVGSDWPLSLCCEPPPSGQCHLVHRPPAPGPSGLPSSQGQHPEHSCLLFLWT